MAFRGNGLSGNIYEKNVKPAIVTVDGVTFGSRRKPYPGTPTAAMLAADNLNIVTVKCKPYPGSAADRHAKAAPDYAAAAFGGKGKAPLAGPGSMEAAARRNEWPDDEEKALDAFVERKFSDPKTVGRAIALAAGASPEKAEVIAATAGYGTTTARRLRIPELPPEQPSRKSA